MWWRDAYCAKAVLHLTIYKSSIADQKVIEYAQRFAIFDKISFLRKCSFGVDGATASLNTIPITV